MPPFNSRNKITAPVPAQKQYHAPTVHLLTRIIALIDEMIAVMEEEIPLVENRKRAQHAELLKRKQRLTLDYRASLKAIVLEPELLKQVPDELRAKARDAGDRLAEVSDRNGRTLRAIMMATQRLVQTIVSMVRSEVLPKSGYANTQPGYKESSYSPLCKPVTVCKTA
jgi:hypothetical protein